MMISALIKWYIAHDYFTCQKLLFFLYLRKQGIEHECHVFNHSTISITTTQTNPHFVPDPQNFVPMKRENPNGVHKSKQHQNLCLFIIPHPKTTISHVSSTISVETIFLEHSSKHRIESITDPNPKNTIRRLATPQRCECVRMRAKSGGY